MSLKYQRIKKQDATLWAPTRWVLQLFSSILFGVGLLTLVCLYGLIGTMPVGPLPTWIAYGLIYSAVVIVPGILGGVLAWRLGKDRSTLFAISCWLGVGGAGLAIGVGVAIWVGGQMAGWQLFPDFYRQYQTTQIFKLPWFEMTELQFYAWWPMRLILGLFVANMVIATIRRIEFNFLNIGVLTVHSGIIILAIGSAIYGLLKIEGDILLMAPESGGRQKAFFYDYQNPSLHVRRPGMGYIDFVLPDLPRWNDHMAGSYVEHLHERPGFANAFNEQLRITIPGVLSYAIPERVIQEDPYAPKNPGLVGHIAIASESERNVPDDTIEVILVGRDGPSEARQFRGPSFEMALLTDLPEADRDLLSSPFEGERALLVEIPEADYRQLHVVKSGDVIDLTEHGYRLTVGEFMAEYPFPVLTEGYRGTQPNVAVVRIDGPDGLHVERWAIHPYPQLTQDFPIDPESGEQVTSEGSGRPIRRDPDEKIRVTYLDASKHYFWFTQTGHDRDEPLMVIHREPGGAVNREAVMTGEKLRLVDIGDGLYFTFLLDRRLNHAVWERVGKSVPRTLRRSDEEGRFLHSMIPVDLAVVGQGDEPVWQQRIWLRFMDYVEQPTADRQPVTVDVPGLGELELAFGRQRHDLPFALALVDFEMIPYPGSNIPRDFRSQLRITEADPNGQIKTSEGITRLNNPLVLHGYKLSQAGWDPQGQEFTVIAVGNNYGIRIIALGGILMSIGIPWAFYVKPAILRHRRRKLQDALNPPKQATESAIQPSQPDQEPSLVNH